MLFRSLSRGEVEQVLSRLMGTHRLLARLLYGTGLRISEALQLRLRAEDIDAVRKVFEVLGQAVLKAQGKPQVIVLDHAGRDVWGEIPGVVGLRAWRDGVQLVPRKWLEADSDGAGA